METPKLSIVQLHDGRPLINDIPGRLRCLADAIEKGEHENAQSCLVLLNSEVKNDWPRMFGYGDVDGDNNPIIIMQMALTWWINRITKRSV